MEVGIKVRPEETPSMASKSSETQNCLESAILYTAEETHWAGIRLSCEHRLMMGKVLAAPFLLFPRLQHCHSDPAQPSQVQSVFSKGKKKQNTFPTPAQHPNTGKESHVLFKGLARSFTVCLTFNVCLFLPSFQNLNRNTKPTRIAKTKCLGRNNLAQVYIIYQSCNSGIS